MTVRAKFKLNSFTTELDSYERDKPVEKRTLNFTPVYQGSEENKKFWQYTPSGSLQLGVVNPDVWKEFEIGEEYYLDFTPA